MSESEEYFGKLKDLIGLGEWVPQTVEYQGRDWLFLTTDEILSMFKTPDVSMLLHHDPMVGMWLDFLEACFQRYAGVFIVTSTQLTHMPRQVRKLVHHAKNCFSLLPKR